MTGVQTCALPISVAAAEAAAELGATALTAIGSGTISATITAANGGSLEEVATSAVTAGAATYAGAIVSQAVSSTVNSSLASSVTNGTISQATSSTISNAVASATSSVAKSLIRNGELDASTVLNAFEAAGAGAAASALTAQVDGFSDLPKGVQAALNRGLADEFLGASSDKITQDMLLASLTGLRGKIDI